MIAFVILTSFVTLIVTKPTLPLNECYSGKITAITTLQNGTVFVASNQYYWLLNNQTLDTINSESKGLVKDLIPGMNSVQMAVSLRVAVNKSRMETILFLTFEDNQYISKAYINNRWENGLPIVRDFMEIIFNRSVSLNTSDNTKRLVVLYFEESGNPTVYISYDKNRNGIHIPASDQNWTQIDSFNSITNKTFDSLWVRDPNSHSLSYMVFVDHHYYDCKLVVSADRQTAEDVCDSQKSVTQLIKCLPKQTNGEQETTKSSLSKRTFVLVVVIILIIAFLILIVVIIVYCKCLKELIALESEKEKSTLKQTPGDDKGKPAIVSEGVPKDRDKNKADQQNEQDQQSAAKEPIDMTATVNQMKEILSRKKKDQKPPKQKPEKSSESPQKQHKHHKTKAKQMDTKKSPKKSKKPKGSEEDKEEMQEKGKREFTQKGGKFEKNVKEIGKMLSEGPQKTKRKPIKAESEVVSQIEDKKSGVKHKPEPQQQSRVEQTNDDRLRQLFSQTPQRTTDDEDRVHQLLGQSKLGALSKQDTDSRVGKLFKE